MWIISQNGMGYELAQLKDIGVRNTVSGHYVLEARMRCDRSRVKLGAFTDKADAKKAMHAIRRGEGSGKSIIRILRGSEAYRYI